MLAIRFQLLFKKRDHETIAPNTLYKKATLSDSLRSLMKKEHWEWFKKSFLSDSLATGAICSFSEAIRSKNHEGIPNTGKNKDKI